LVISGDDFTMIDAVRAGADGIISVAANAYPSIMNSTYIQLLYENDKSKPQNISKTKLNSSEFVLNNFFQLIFDEGNPSGIKFALSKLNLCKEKVRLPLTGISNKLKDKILKFLKKYPANDL
jgi:4-hydroxy-tetrahydrodipicolinate synthase